LADKSGYFKCRTLSN